MKLVLVVFDNRLERSGGKGREKELGAAEGAVGPVLFVLSVVVV